MSVLWADPFEKNFSVPAAHTAASRDGLPGPRVLSLEALRRRLRHGRLGVSGKRSGEKGRIMFPGTGSFSITGFTGFCKRGVRLCFVYRLIVSGYLCAH